MLRTGAELLPDTGNKRLTAVFADDAHVQVEATWLHYQRIIAAYRDPDRTAAKTTVTEIIDELRTGVPQTLTELITLGRTLNRRAADVLAYFDRPGTSNGPTEANGRLEHLRGTAPGFRNLTTTSPAARSRPADSDPDHTLDLLGPQRSRTSHSAVLAIRCCTARTSKIIFGIWSRSSQVRPGQ